VKTFAYILTVPKIPDDWPEEKVRELLAGRIKHPYDAAFDYSIDMTPLVGLPESEASNDVDTRRRANPERDGNGCMVYRTPAQRGK